MKRLLTLLVFAPLLALSLSAPMASAATEMNLGICNMTWVGEGNGSIGITSTGDDKVDSDTVNQKKAELDEAYSALIEGQTVECGKPNSAELIEKGDCKDSVITEITEIVTNVKPENIEGASVINVYQGVCCLIYDQEGVCYETRSYYTQDLSTCQRVANGTSSNGVTGGGAKCQIRQWLIADTGMGILQLYVKQLFTFGSMIVGAVAVGIIILNGVKISVSGVSGDISDAKQKILQSFSGIILLFFAAIILYIVNPGFFS